MSLQLRAVRRGLKDVKVFLYSLRGRRKKGRRRGEGEREKGIQSPSPFPFLSIPYPLPLSTPATQAISLEPKKLYKERG